MESNLTQLGQKYSLVLCHWNGGINVMPDKPICEAEEKSLSRAYFTIFNRKGVFGIHLSGLYDKGEKKHYNLKSARLKKCKTLEAALAWINRFRHLNDMEQEDILGRHEIQARDKNLVTLLCDYWRLEALDKQTGKWLLFSTNINHAELNKLYESLKSTKGQYRIIKSVRRHFTTDKTTVKELTDNGKIYGLNITTSPVKNATMGVSDYNRTPKRNTTARFHNKR